MTIKTILCSLCELLGLMFFVMSLVCGLISANNYQLLLSFALVCIVITLACIVASTFCRGARWPQITYFGICLVWSLYLLSRLW